jgi:hypothetical protein
MNTLRTLALATLLAAAPLAQAATWSMPNKAGGSIVLTDRECSVPNSGPLLEVYSFAKDGTRQDGCWGLWDDMVQITWLNGRRGTFSPDAFTASPAKPVKPAAAQRKSLDL